MDFQVIDSKGSCDEYSGNAVYTILGSSGVLRVQPRGEGRPNHVLYGPHGWLRVVVPEPSTVENTFADY